MEESFTLIAISIPYREDIPIYRDILSYLGSNLKAPFARKMLGVAAPEYQIDQTQEVAPC
jgi:hypothetical protein